MDPGTFPKFMCPPDKNPPVSIKSPKVITPKNFVDLDGLEHFAAEQIGWTKSMWNNTTSYPEIYNKKWEELSVIEKDSLLYLGYTMERWNQLPPLHRVSLIRA